MSESFEEILARDGRLVYKTRGGSMNPMLYEDRDLVIIEPKKGPLSRYDVAFYKIGGRYVLHRVIRAKGDLYLIRGDSTYITEKVPDSSVLGVLTGFVRDGKQYSVTDKKYVSYYKKRVFLYPARFVLKKLRLFAGRVKRKLFH